MLEFFDIATFLAFIAIIAILIYKDRKNVKFEGIMMMRRTQKGKNFIENISKNKKFWNIFFSIAVIVSIPVMIFGFYLMASNAFGIITDVSKAPPVSLVLPAPVASVTQVPAVMLLPWWLWVIGVFSVMIPHEFAHGIASRVSGIRIKSLGWMLLLFLPGAFCEPDEKQLQKSNWKTKMKVYAAGSFANILFSLPFLLLGSAIYYGMFMDPCMTYNSTVSGSPMAAISSAGGCIFSLNNTPITNPDDLQALLTSMKPGTKTEISLLTDGSSAVTTYNITTTARPDNISESYLGIDGPYYKARIAKYDFAAEFSEPLIMVAFVSMWIFFLNLGIGIINLLPIKPLDGGLIMEEIVNKLDKNKKRASKIVIVITLITLALLLFDIFGVYVLRAIGF